MRSSQPSPEFQPSPRPTRRVSRAPRRSTILQRDEILEAAVAMADDVGVEAITMRSLADVLGVSAMSLYAHVSNKDEVLDAVIERRLRAAGLPDANQPWMEWMAAIAQDLRSILVREPALLDRYCRRPVGVPAALERMEEALGVLLRAGFADAEALDAYASVHTYTIGFAALEASRAVPTARARRSPSALDDAHLGYWPAYFSTLDASRYPQLTRLRPDLVGFTSDVQFSAGLAALLEGIDRRRKTALPPRRPLRGKERR